MLYKLEKSDGDMHVDYKKPSLWASTCQREVEDLSQGSY